MYNNASARVKEDDCGCLGARRGGRLAASARVEQGLASSARVEYWRPRRASRRSTRQGLAASRGRRLAASARVQKSTRAKGRYRYRLRTAVMDELQLHAGYAAKWGADLGKGFTPLPATTAYTSFLDAVASDLASGWISFASLRGRCPGRAGRGARGPTVGGRPLAAARTRPPGARRRRRRRSRGAERVYLVRAPRRRRATEGSVSLARRRPTHGGLSQQPRPFFLQIGLLVLRRRPPAARAP